MTPTELQKAHDELVAKTACHPDEIYDDLTQQKLTLIHAIIGMNSEMGELTDAIKKHTIYGHPLSDEIITNIIEELGDIEWYTSLLRQALQISRDMVLRKNIDKLGARYPDGHFTVKHSIERLDKQDE